MKEEVTTEQEETPKEVPTTFTDSRDGEVYTTVKIGEQEWMAENLRYNVEGSLLNPANPTKEYRRLYTMEQAMKACPEGWHLPSDDDWKGLGRSLKLLANEIDKKEWRGDIAAKLKSNTGWNAFNDQAGGGTNSSGFNALPAGAHWSSDFTRLGEDAHFATSTAYESDGVWLRVLSYNTNKVSRRHEYKTFAQSCRCLKD